MANMPDVTMPVDDHCQTALSFNPFLALRAHFGMLLGVDDFETMDGYHRGKQRLHNAWLHGAGVVWGLPVVFDASAGEIRVGPGVALDVLGRELHLDAEACVNLARWFIENKDDPALEAGDLGVDGGKRCAAHVVIQFRACLTRQVPALVEPCSGSTATSAYSRIFETVELRLRPGPVPDAAGPVSAATMLPASPRLRLLFGLAPPRTDDRDAILDADQEVLDTLAHLAALPPAEQPLAMLAALRRFAALDLAEVRPAAIVEDEELPLFPAEDHGVLLAEISNLTFRPVPRDNAGGDGDAAKATDWRLDAAADDGVRVDMTGRPVLLAAWLLQELLARAISVPADAGEPRVNPEDAGGPRIDPENVTLAPDHEEGKSLSFVASKPLDPVSVKKEAISVSSYDPRKGWTDVKVDKVDVVTIPDSTENETKVSVKLATRITGNRVRLIVAGTGRRPVLGADGIPLAGSTLDPRPGGRADGLDFVHMLDRSET